MILVLSLERDINLESGLVVKFKGGVVLGYPMTYTAFSGLELELDCGAHVCSSTIS